MLIQKEGKFCQENELSRGVGETPKVHGLWGIGGQDSRCFPLKKKRLQRSEKIFRVVVKQEDCSSFMGSG